MIPAPLGLVALYRGQTPRPVTKRVVAFDDEGRPLIVDDTCRIDKTRLIRADAISTYDGMAEDPDPDRMIALAPAGGWRIEYISEDGTSWSEPLVGWGVNICGEVGPLITDSRGWVMDVHERYGGEFRIYHPDATAEGDSHKFVAVDPILAAGAADVTPTPEETAERMGGYIVGASRPTLVSDIPTRSDQ